MTRHPGAEFIPLAFLLPSWFIRAAVNVIHNAADAWDEVTYAWVDEDDEALP